MLLIAPSCSTRIVAHDIIVSALVVEVDIVLRCRSVESVSTVHVLVVGCGSLVWRTRTDEQLCRRNVSHIHIKRTIEDGEVVLNQFTECVAGGVPWVTTEDRTIGEVIVC